MPDNDVIHLSQEDYDALEMRLSKIYGKGTPARFDGAEIPKGKCLIHDNKVYICE